jgi:hypothetical protein
MPLHPAWVKNISRRVLWAALEPDISKADRQLMEVHFGRACAYCERPLGNRWHADHLLPVDRGGFNSLGNRVPACPSCNEHEKREMPWREFLTRKCEGDHATLKLREARITAWCSQHAFDNPPVSDGEREAWERAASRVAEAVDAAWNELKRVRADRPALLRLRTAARPSDPSEPMSRCGNDPVPPTRPSSTIAATATGIYMVFPTSEALRPIYRGYKTHVNHRHTKVGIASTSFAARQRSYAGTFGPEVEFVPLVAVARHRLRSVEQQILESLSRRFRRVGDAREWFDTCDRELIASLVLDAVQSQVTPEKGGPSDGAPAD